MSNYGKSRCKQHATRNYIEEEAKERQFVAVLVEPVTAASLNETTTNFETDAVYKLEQYSGGFHTNSFSYVIKEFDVEHVSLRDSCAVLLLIFVVLRVISYICLRRQVRAKR